MLLEREAVLGRLGHHLKGAVTGQGRVLLLHGAAGVGKTAITRRFAETARDQARVLIGACDPMSTPQPLGPLVDLAAAIDEDLGRSILGTYSVREIFRRVLAELARESTVFVLEDVHWADAATLDLLRYLARRVEATSTVVVATYRDDELGQTHPLSVALGQLATYPWVRRYSVEPLSRQAVAVMAVGRGVDVNQLYRITGGNPFFVTEVLNSGVNDIPATVQHAVAGRLAGLSEAARFLTEVIAVLGCPASPQLLAALLPGMPAALEQALCAGVLFADGPAIKFRHELARRAALQTVPGYRLQDLHRRVLTALCSNPGAASQLARLAHHADEAHDAAAVLEFAPAAAAEATALGAHQEAAAQYTRAMRYADDLPPERRAMLLEGRALSSYLANQVTEASACLQEAVLLRHGQGDRLREGDDLRWLSHMLWPAGRAEASHVATAAVRVLQEVGQTRELAWAYVNMAQIASLDYDAAAAADYAQRAIELGSRFDEPAIAIRARAYAALAEALSRDQGWLELEQTWELAVKAGLPEHAGMIGFLACWAAATHRDLDRADHLLADVVPYCLDQDLMLFLSYSRGASALAMLHRGQWSKAAATATTILADPGPLPINRLAPLVVLGLTQARRGKAGAWPLPPESTSMDHPADRYPFGLAWEAWAEATWLAGDDTRAVAVAESGLAKVTSAADPWLAGALACWCQRAGGTPRKVQAAEPYALELAGEWATAAARWERRGCTYEAAMARLAGDVPAVRHALDVFEALGAEPAAARARARLKSLGVSRGTRGPNSATRTCLFGLTKRQMEVLHLLKDDLSDGQIAAQLHIATKTASCHVSAVLTKLGVQTRHQAVRKLAQTPRGNDDQDGSTTTSG